jgi:hemin uptake protein HemP
VPAHQQNQTAPAVRPKEAAPRRVSSEQLLGAAHELIIVHAGCEYRLRLTRANKLILTK